MDFKVGDEIVFIKQVRGCPDRKPGTFDVIKALPNSSHDWEVWLVNNLGCNFEHIRKASKLDKVLK